MTRVVGPPVALVLLWEFFRFLADVDARLLPSASEIAKALLGAIHTSFFWWNLCATLLRALGGFALSLALGVPIGVLLASSKFIARSVLPLTNFFRSVPVSTLYPCFVLVAGVGNRSKVAMIAFASVFVVMLSTATGVMQARPNRPELLRILGASRFDVIRRVLIWEAVPLAVLGARTALSLALVVAVLTEMFMGAHSGIGQAIMDTYSVYDLARMYAYIVSAGCVGVGLNIAFDKGERLLMPWLGK